MHRVLDAAQRSERLVEGLLLLARGERGPSELRPVDLSEVLAKVCRPNGGGDPEPRLRHNDAIERARAALAPAAGELAGAGTGMLTLGPVADHLADLPGALPASRGRPEGKKRFRPCDDLGRGQRKRHEHT